MSWFEDDDEVALARAAPPILDISSTLIQSGISAAVMNAGTPGLIKYTLNTFFPGLLAQFQRKPRLANLVGSAVAFWALWPYLDSQLRQAWRYVSSYFMSSVTVEAHDHAFASLVQWLSHRRVYNDATAFRAYSIFEKSTGRPGHSRQLQMQQQQQRRRQQQWQGQSGWDDDQESGWGPYSNPQPEMDTSSHRFAYSPETNLQFLLYRGSIVFVEQHTSGSGSSSSSSNSGKIVLSCLGRSARAAKGVLEEASQLYADSGSLVTVVWRARGGSWSQSSCKAQRSVDSVSIDGVQKARLLADMDEYVAPQTAAWYAARGIPYRRGYLFHGPPGTGKSSLAQAVAARYKRDIYTMPLLDPVMSDSLLLELLNRVPNSSVVLLEDVDSAGLTREYKDQSTAVATTAAAAASPASPLQQHYHRQTQYVEPKTQVTLSGLLNAIDGVESAEGHILIMTTNKIDELDEALIRSGRISVRIGFRLASPAQAQEIFMRMMQEEVYVEPIIPTPTTTTTTTTTTSSSLTQLAAEFASRIPDNTYSPADLQDYLLQHKTAPQRALDELAAWQRDRQRELAERARRDAEIEEAAVRGGQDLQHAWRQARRRNQCLQQEWAGTD